MTDMARQLQIGDEVRKKQGFKFIGFVLAIYSYMGSEYAVVVCNPDKYQDGLQHIYKLSQLEKI